MAALLGRQACVQLDLIRKEPWQKIAADIFDFQGRAFLLIVDYFSKYPEVLQLSGKTSGSLIAQFKAVFARHGVPEILIADHVPFASAEMARFAHDWGFNITHSSPNYTQSNSMAERAIKTVKTMLKAAAQSGTDPHLALLTLRNTPVTGLKYSPAQILMGRVLRSTLPTSKAVLRPSTPKHIQLALQQRQSQQKSWYDRTAAPLPALRRGQRAVTDRQKSLDPYAALFRSRGQTGSNNSEHSPQRAYKLVNGEAGEVQGQAALQQCQRTVQFQKTHREGSQKG
ncbi:hypothetical protein H4Q32_025223 [Labeo rohita]|uniref:Integrase catalytic domain-containing protein n=1 Tax=Labeo rohita TaxID=84645 RepID=A0ABQ8L6S5_LABRO|nr:hypothetical protein H4Q32_025223 [Labeo rohita]